MQFYNHKGQQLYVRVGQVLPIGSMVLEGSKWRTLTSPETVRKIIVKGNPYDDEDDTFILVPMTDEAWDSYNAPV